MNKPVGIFLFLLSILLSGCSGISYRVGAPVAGAGPVPQHPAGSGQADGTAAEAEQGAAVAGEQEVQIAVYEPPAPVEAKPINSAAVVALVQRAGQQQRDGNMVGAAAALERALRLEPRNAHLWNRLARVRLIQKRYGQAESLAAKSNTLAAADRALHYDNWRLIARSRRAVGDSAGAREAELRADRLR